MTHIVNLGHGNWILSSRIMRTPYDLAITTVKSETKILEVNQWVELMPDARLM